MTHTVLDHWWPVTYDFGLIRSDLQATVAARHRIYAKAELGITSARVEAPLHDCLAMLEPLSPAPTKELFLETTFGWTAFFQNGCRGSDPFLPMSQLSKELGRMALRACATPPQALYSAVILEIYDTLRAGGDEYGYRRSIAAANDGGRWVFEQSGVPFSFEDNWSYNAPRKKDRFTPAMLNAFIQGLGAQPLSDGALERQGVCDGFLLQRAASKTRPFYSLAEAKAL